MKPSPPWGAGARLRDQRMSQGGGWWCESCGTHHINPTCSVCRMCRRPRAGDGEATEAKGKPREGVRGGGKKP
eukprot:405723-Alexandrium_andersonii.AAC.1